jgi:hypothetical protein
MAAIFDTPPTTRIMACEARRKEFADHNLTYVPVRCLLGAAFAHTVDSGQFIYVLLGAAAPNRLGV